MDTQSTHTTHKREQKKVVPKSQDVLCVRRLIWLVTAFTGARVKYLYGPVKKMTVALVVSFNNSFLEFSALTDNL